MRNLIEDLRTRLGRSLALEFRMDGAVFSEGDHRAVGETKSRYAVKVPFFRWLGLLALIRERQRWHTLGEGLDYFETPLDIAPWGKEATRGGLSKSRASRNEKELTALSI